MTFKCVMRWEHYSTFITIFNWVLKEKNIEPIFIANKFIEGWRISKKTSGEQYIKIYLIRKFSLVLIWKICSISLVFCVDKTWKPFFQKPCEVRLCITLLLLLSRTMSSLNTQYCRLSFFWTLSVLEENNRRISR